MGIVQSEIIFSRTQWNEIKLNGNKMLIIQSIIINIVALFILSLIINFVVSLTYKIQPSIFQDIFIFAIQPIFLAAIDTVIEMHTTYIINTMLYDLKETSRNKYKRYFTTKNIGSNFAAGIIVFINFQSIANSSILSLFGMYIAIMALASLMGLAKTKQEFNDFYRKIIEEINQDEIRS